MGGNKNHRELPGYVVFNEDTGDGEERDQARKSTDAPINRAIRHFRTLSVFSRGGEATARRAPRIQPSPVRRSRLRLIQWDSLAAGGNSWQPRNEFVTTKPGTAVFVSPRIQRILQLRKVSFLQSRSALIMIAHFPGLWQSKRYEHGIHLHLDITVRERDVRNMRDHLGVVS